MDQKECREPPFPGLSLQVQKYNTFLEAMWSECMIHSIYSTGNVLQHKVNSEEIQNLFQKMLLRCMHCVCSRYLFHPRIAVCSLQTGSPYPVTRHCNSTYFRPPASESWSCICSLLQNQCTVEEITPGYTCCVFTP